MKLYRNFSSSEEIDQEYNLRARMPGMDETLAEYIAMSESTRDELECELDVRFGSTLDETVDVFPASRPGSPVLLFIHGGYWRALSAKEFSFVARGFTTHGFTVAVSNYSLCPKVGMEEITRQNRAAAAWLAKHAAGFNGDPGHMIMMGHSAGGHQVGMLATTDWSGDYGLAPDLMKQGIAISGIYDLEPLRYSYLQPILQLDHELIRRQSPCRNIPQRGPPLLCYAGALETEEFRRQSGTFCRQWCEAGLAAEYRERGGEDHFTVVLDLGRPDSNLVREIITFAGIRG